MFEPDDDGKLLKITSNSRWRSRVFDHCALGNGLVNLDYIPFRIMEENLMPFVVDFR